MAEYKPWTSCIWYLRHQKCWFEACFSLSFLFLRHAALWNVTMYRTTMGLTHPAACLWNCKIVLAMIQVVIHSTRPKADLMHPRGQDHDNAIPILGGESFGDTFHCGNGGCTPQAQSCDGLDSVCFLDGLRSEDLTSKICGQWQKVTDILIFIQCFLEISCGTLGDHGFTCSTLRIWKGGRTEDCLPFYFLHSLEHTIHNHPCIPVHFGIKPTKICRYHDKGIPYFVSVRETHRLEKGFRLLQILYFLGDVVFMTQFFPKRWMNWLEFWCLYHTIATK